MNNFYDFNDAKNNFKPIPAGTIAKLALHIKLGGYNDFAQGWTMDYATKNWNTGAVYLNCEFTVLSGEYLGRKIRGIIGLYSEKNNNTWGEIGRRFIRSILNSARGFGDNDDSEEAQAARKINSLADLDKLEFIGLIEVEKDQKGNDRNMVKSTIGPEHKDYAKLIGKEDEQTTAKPEWA